MTNLSVNNGKIQPFTVLNYTKNGKKCEATKNGEVVTIKEENGSIRQMPLSEFFKSELPNITLEKAPVKDTVEINQKNKNNANLVTIAPPKNNATGDKKLDVAV